MAYMLIVVVVVVGIVVYAYLKKKQDNTEKSPKKELGQTNKEDTPPEIVVVTKEPWEEKGFFIKNGKKQEVTIKHMPQGLQVFDENGNVVVDITDRLIKYLGVVEINGTNGSLTNDELSEGDLWYYPLNIKNPPPTPSIHTEYHAPIITKSGKNISWDYGSYQANTRLSMVLLYGVY